MPPPGAPIKVRTIGGREAIVLEKMQRGWFRVALDGNANEEGGANERKSLRYFAPGQEHLLNAAPKAAPKPKAKVPAQPGPVPAGAVQAAKAAAGLKPPKPASAAPRAKKRKPAMKTCPNCSVRAYNRSTTCPSCGAAFPKKAKKGDAADVQVERSTLQSETHAEPPPPPPSPPAAVAPPPAAAPPPPPPPPPAAVAPPPAAVAPPPAAAPPPPPPPQPGFFLTNTSASLVQWFRFRFPGSAEAGDKFEGLVNRWAMVPEDILNMDLEDCKRMLREEGFETAVVGMLQMRLRSACRAWMQGAAPAMPGAW